MGALSVMQSLLMAQPHVETAQGEVATFDTDFKAPLKSLTVNIEPIQEGSGDPSPDNVRPISGRNVAHLYATGENLIPLTMPSDAFAGTFPTGSTSISSATYARCFCMYVGKNQYLRYQTARNGASVSLAFADEHLTSRQGAVIYGAYNMTYRDQPIFSGEHPYLVVNVSRATMFDPGGGLDLYEVMLSFGSSAKAYIPRADPQIVTITWESEAGIVYDGSLIIKSDGTGEIISDYRFITLTGNEAFSEQGGCFRTRLSSSKIAIDDVAICSHITENPAITSNNNLTGFRVYNRSATAPVGATLLFRFDETKAQTLEEFLSYLTEQFEADTPVQVAYKVTTPVIYSLTSQQLKALLGTNNIWSDAGNVEVKFWKHG